MSQHCPHCQAEQTDGSLTCAQCGAPAETPLFTFAPLSSQAFTEQEFTESKPPPAAGGVSPQPVGLRPAVRGLSWKIPAALAILAVAGLSLRSFRPDLAAKPPAHPSLTAAAQPAPNQPGPPTAEPLSITLRSIPETSAAVTVGKAVTIAATAAALPGRPTTITLFYQQDQGQELLMAQAQGTQCRASWTPARPGEYSFTATAREDQTRVAQAAPLIFHVAAAPTIAAAAPTIAAAAPKIAVPPVVLPPAPHGVVPRYVSAFPQPSKAPKPAQPTAKILGKTAGKQPVSPDRFHVAAALLPFERSAAVLATALHRRGYPAVVRPRINGAGNRRYVVQTGVFSSAPAARQQSQQLLHDGYPAFTYRAP